MSRDRIYIYIYVDGVMTPAWKDNGPGYARKPGQGGSLVTGVSEYEQNRRNHQRNRQAKAKDAAA